MNRDSVPEQARAEPEIIPPDDRGRRVWGDWRTSVDGNRTQRVYVARVGPLGFAFVAFTVSALAVLLFLVVVGAFVVLIPLAGLLLAAAVVASLLRGWRRT
jgi:hypothetical protein